MGFGYNLQGNSNATPYFHFVTPLTKRSLTIFLLLLLLFFFLKSICIGYFSFTKESKKKGGVQELLGCKKIRSEFKYSGVSFIHIYI